MNYCALEKQTAVVGFKQTIFYENRRGSIGLSVQVRIGQQGIPEDDNHAFSGTDHQTPHWIGSPTAKTLLVLFRSRENSAPMAKWVFEVRKLYSSLAIRGKLRPPKSPSDPSFFGLLPVAYPSPVKNWKGYLNGTNWATIEYAATYSPPVPSQTGQRSYARLALIPTGMRIF